MEPDSVLDIYFSDRKGPPVLYREKRTGSGPHVPSETSRHRAPPSKLGHDPCPVRRELVAAGTCCVRKAAFFRCSCRLWSLIWVSTPQRRKLGLFSVFRSRNCRLDIRTSKIKAVSLRMIRGIRCTSIATRSSMHSTGQPFLDIYIRPYHIVRSSRQLYSGECCMKAYFSATLSGSLRPWPII